MRILGCDYSTHYVDFVAIEEGQHPIWKRYELFGHDSFERARSVGRMVPGRANTFWDSCLALGIEEPAGRNTGHMFRVQGAVLARLPERLLVEKWMPSQWRKAVGLKGNASKDDVSDWAVDNLYTNAFNTANWPQDACDAYCIAVATRHAVRQEQ